ncbi:MAG: B12-binding domain-containing radical SAM protein [Chloroflexi bacterium]|nr:B12-binding domain-containing radical SAM protein [Chloroflexota bacterium]
MAYIAGYLRKAGVECRLIDGNFEALDMADIERRLLSFAPSVVGVTSMSHEIRRAAEVAALAKKILPGVRTVVGGPHATALPIQTLEEFPAFDVAVFGEGEHTTLDLARARNGLEGLEAISGIAFRSTSGIRQNSPATPVPDLDSLPFPAWDLVPGRRRYPVMTARGCPFRCNFCMRVMGRHLRKRSPENVVGELKLLVETYNAEFIHFLDETFTVDKRHLHRLLELMLEKGLPTKLHWDAQTRADLVDFDLLHKMRRAGCEWLGLGIESGNARILKASGKGTSLEGAKKAVKAAKKAGIKTDGFFILGHPFETPRTAKDTIDFAVMLNTTRVTFGLMTPYPGTEIYDMARRGEGGYRLISADWDDFNKNIGNSLELETLDRKQMEKLQVWGYLKFYLVNVRLIAGLQYFLSQRRLGLAILKKLLTLRKNRRNPGLSSATNCFDKKENGI